MAVTVTDLSTLNQASVDQFQTELVQLIQEYQPLVDVSGGVFEDLLIHLKAILDAATEENIDLVRQANSLQQVIANPALADPAIVDLLLSNFNLVRNPGTIASGNVTIVLSQLVGTVIPIGATFTINGVAFVSPVTYGIRTSPTSVISSTDRLISQITTGQYGFTINLQAVNTGTAGNVMRGLAVTPDNIPAAFLKAYVASDFTGGTDPSTNAQLLTELASGMAIGAWSNRVSIESMIRKQTAFANIENLSIIGFGDPEMLRDQHSIWPGSTGGRSDLYLRSQALYQSATVTKTATLISKAGAVGTWQFGVNRDDAPGFYKVDRILLTTEDPTDAGFQPTSDIRGFDLTNVTGPPDIVTALEAVYSPYQTSVIQFADNVTDATALVTNVATNDYTIIFQAMPLVADVQDFLLGRTVRPPMGDVLVKAPIPCYTFISLTVNYKNGTTAPVVTTIQNAIATAVNNLDFSGQLPASLIDQVVHNTVSNLVSVTSIDLLGQLRGIDGTITILHDTIVIAIPEDDDLMQSGRTAAFFVNPSDIAVNLVAVDVIPV